MFLVRAPDFGNYQLAADETGSLNGHSERGLLELYAQSSKVSALRAKLF